MFYHTCWRHFGTVSTKPSNDLLETNPDVGLQTGGGDPDWTEGPRGAPPPCVNQGRWVAGHGDEV